MLKFLTPEQKEKRREWRRTRKALEENHYKHNRYGDRKKSRWDVFEYLLRYFKIFLKPTRLYEIGYQNAQNIIVNRFSINFSDLPKAFDNYRILHLSDLHLDFIGGMANNISAAISNIPSDLCVLSGDYRMGTKGNFKQILKPLQNIMDAVHAPDGVFAVLGNHDTYAMAADLENMGIRFLANETVTISKANDQIALTGVDDPHYYYTHGAQRVLRHAYTGFKIALVHTPELYDIAAENKYNLYLCGHTHGGQICLPGGIPVVTHLDTGKRFYRGLWHYDGMAGFTSQGCGTVGIPVRFFTQSEIALITLKKGQR